MVKVIELNDNNKLIVTKKMFESNIDFDYYDPTNITSVRLGTLCNGKWNYPNVGSFSKLLKLSSENNGIKNIIKRGQFDDNIEFDLRWKCFKRRFKIQIHKLTKNII